MATAAEEMVTVEVVMATAGARVAAGMAMVAAWAVGGGLWRSNRRRRRELRWRQRGR